MDNKNMNDLQLLKQLGLAHTLPQSVREDHLYSLYLDYVNNFLTLKRWCEYYSITESAGKRIVRYFKAGHN